MILEGLTRQTSFNYQVCRSDLLSALERTVERRKGVLNMTLKQVDDADIE
jgi:hypothetical protein